MSLTSKLQSKVEDCINEISDELELPVTYYPVVYYMGRNFSLKNLGVSKRDFNEGNAAKKKGSSFYLLNQKAVILGSESLEEISEESGHFVHHNVSGTCFKKMDKYNVFAFNVIFETLGFFSSKLIVPERVNTYAGLPDSIFEREEFNKFKSENALGRYFTIYNQGYNLGELLYHAYISGVIPKKTIRQLFFNNFEEKNSPLRMFSYLKMDLLNFENKKAG